jgi:triacylglycerol lipase
MDSWLLFSFIVAFLLTVALAVHVPLIRVRRSAPGVAPERDAAPGRVGAVAELERPRASPHPPASARGTESNVAVALGQLGSEAPVPGFEQRWVGVPGAEPCATEESAALEPSSPHLPSSPPPQRAVPSWIVLRRPRATRHPILLAHGYFGFDRIGVPALGQEYFRGVRPRLEALGYSVFVTRVSPAAGIAQRAAQLAQQIEQLGVPRVNIIAHSMGGLDARLAISRLGLAARVASLTTIGTPHHGTPLADMAAGLGEWRTLRRLLSSIGINVDGLYDVSTRRMRDFNRVILDRPEVIYASVVGALSAEAVAAVHSLLSPGHSYLLRKVGPNDGIVSAASQRWGDSIVQVEADHWAQIGWFGSFDVESFYVQLVEGLAARDL